MEMIQFDPGNGNINFVQQVGRFIMRYIMVGQAAAGNYLRNSKISSMKKAIPLKNLNITPWSMGFIIHMLNMNGSMIIMALFYTGTSGIESIDNQIVGIFPNPTSGIIKISGLTQPAEVKIYSVQGQLLKSEYQKTNKIDISALPVGVYFLNITTRDQVINKTIIMK